MRRASSRLLLLLGALAVAVPVAAAEPKVTLVIRPAADVVARGSALAVTVEAEIADGWHINSHEPTEKFLVPTTLSLQLPDGVTTTAVEYPAAETRRFAFAGDVELQVYEGTVPMRTTLRVPDSFAADTLTIDAALRYQACDDTTCLPPTRAHATAAVPIGAGAGGAAPPVGDGSSGALVDDEATRFAALLDGRGLIATLGVMLLLGAGLNLTPCVYPLISVTIAYFGGPRAGRAHVAWLGSLYVLGIALSFSTLGLVAALSGGLFGAALQQPVVVLGIAGLMVVLALGSFGLYQFRPPAALLRWAGGTAHGGAGAPANA